MRQTLSLDGSDWQVRPHLGTDAALAAAARPDSAASPDWTPARVPGTVVDDLWRAGEVPDPYHERNSLLLEWVPQRAWTYRRSFEVPEVARARAGSPGRRRAVDTRIWLRFAGVDHAAHVFLDGELIGSHAGMFVPFEFEVGDRLRASGAGGGTGAGRHELAVVVEPAPPSEPQVGRTSRVRVHKSRMTYGWDFCPRLVHQGIWRSVELEIAGGIRITDVWARPTLDAGLRHGIVAVRVRLDIDGRGRGGAAISARLEDPDGRTVAAAEADAPTDPAAPIEVALELAVDEPALWWPNGLGPARLYRLVIRAGDDGLADERAVPVGFRTIERIRNPGARPDARPWLFVVNGRRMPIHGWNWVPIDALYGVPRPDRLAHLLRLAAVSHANLLRVWGGGLIESDEFYDACDRLGLLVWQEFGQSSSGLDNEPATDDAFVGRMAVEAESIVPLRRNHPSLAIWCGGNELADADGRPLDDTAPVLGALNEVVERLDPGRIWLPTSPSGPRFHNRVEDIAADPGGLHDVHGPWEHQGLGPGGQTALYDLGTSLFNSEFGVEGMTNRRTHERLISPRHRWPADRSNPVYRHLGDWWNNAALVQAAFGGSLDDLETLRRASQLLQADGLRYAVEANGRRWPRNGGSIPWQLNESYPNAWCTSTVDHRGDAKPAFHAVTRAYASTVVCARLPSMALDGADRLTASVWAWCLDGTIGPATVRRRIVAGNGAVHHESTSSVELQAGEPVEVEGVADTPLPSSLTEIFFLDLDLRDPEGAIRATNRYLMTRSADLGALLDLAPASVDVAVERAGQMWRLRLQHRGGPAAVGIVVADGRPIDEPGWAELDDSGFHLFPGETRAVAATWAEAPADGRRLRFEGWNVASVDIG